MSREAYRLGMATCKEDAAGVAVMEMAEPSCEA
jgi:hypothetical protein